MKDDARIAAEYEALKVEHARVVKESRERIAELEAELSMARTLLAGVSCAGIAELKAAAEVQSEAEAHDGAEGGNNSVVITVPKELDIPEPPQPKPVRRTKLKGAKE